MVKEGDRTWENRSHFLGTAALAMRRILVERARKKLRLKRGAGVDVVSIDEKELASPTAEDRVLLVDQCLERLEKEDAESARVVTMKFFGGLTNREVAAVLGVSARSVDRQWAYARALLLAMMEKEV
jgi:RNA polymerase sigma factor (TIGR02999 family)